MSPVRKVLFTAMLLATPLLAPAAAVGSHLIGLSLPRSVSTFPSLMSRSGAGIVTLNTSTIFNSSQLVYIEPLRIKVTLPWWTSVIGGSISFLIAFKAVTWDWDRRDLYTAVEGSEKKRKRDPWNFSRPSALFAVFGLSSTFIQNLALLITILDNRNHLGLVTPVTANAYILLFAGSATLWTARILDYTIPLIIGWVNVLLTLLNFVLLSLPVIGSTGLYQAYSPHCMQMLDQFNSNDCDPFSVHSPVNYSLCSTSLDLQFGRYNDFHGGFNHLATDFLNWGYALLIAVLLAFTLKGHFHYLRSNRTIPKQAGLAGKVMRWVIVVGLAIAIYSWYYYASTAFKHDAVQATVYVYPSLSNSTSFVPSATNGTCVGINLPGAVSSLGEVLSADSKTVARLLFNVL